MQTGVIVNTRKSDGLGLKEEGSEGDDHAMEAVFDDIMTAIKNNDKKAGAAAVRAAFEIADSEPHVEGEHLNEEEI